MKIATRMNIVSLLLASAGIAAASVAHASDGTISINGSVLAATCKINGGTGGSSNATAELPKVTINNLGSAGTTTGRTPFKLELTGCSTDTGSPTKVGVLFEPGTTVDSTTGRLHLNAGTSQQPAAKNVQIQLSDSNQRVINVGTSPAQMVTIGNDGTATLTNYAEYYATGVATAGAANTSITYSLVYQ